ncbi:GyrI-like domain-containing protein [Streptomyces sp. NPDC087440]|uniref:GyrI-like domain-containing protein n=1 Tax=Streptomyces sp. NPDC087440 TaxID=3365790 RepID=UPI0038179541
MRYEPEIVECGEQPYAGVRRRVRRDHFAPVADRIPELIGWLAARGTEPAGGPFLRYNVIGTDGELEVEAGVPVAVAPEPEGDVRAGVLPAGRYATLTHVGHPDELAGVTEELIAWAGARGLEWDMTEAGDGEHWVGRTETFLTDPRVEPDLNKWQTRLAIRLADG